jgi:hypothetical protein
MFRFLNGFYSNIFFILNTMNFCSITTQSLYVKSGCIELLTRLINKLREKIIFFVLLFRARNNGRKVTGHVTGETNFGLDILHFWTVKLYS